MKIHLSSRVCAMALGLCATGVWAQNAMDGYQLSQSDLKGTARFMSMGGAFGALGGDLSTLSQNPAGIGVYRSSELGFTLDLDCQSAKSSSIAGDFTIDQTRLLLNNIGAVGTFRLNNSAFKNLNFGFTYNKAASFNRRFGGNLGALQTSLSNYIAGVSNSNELTIGDVHTTTGYDPYNPNDGGYVSPWISILGYDSYLTNPQEQTLTDEQGDYTVTDWFGQYGYGTSGSGWYSYDERGGIDEYNLSFGGNVNDVFFWGMDFGIIDFNYTANTYYGEDLNNAYIPDNSGNNVQTSANWNLYNYYNVNGNGFNYKLGFIVKPIQELRFGFAFHTPTWYSFTQNFYGSVDYTYGGGQRKGLAETNDGYDGYYDFHFRSPWKLIFSAAGVIGKSMILSFDYEWQPYNGMHFTDPYTSYYDYAYGQDTYFLENQTIKDVYRQTNTLRVGAEYRVTPQFSVRAGYCYVSSPVKEEARNGYIYTYDTYNTRPQYLLDNTTNYVTFGLGYRYKHFYIDGAYVWKHRSTDYRAFESDYDSNVFAPSATVTNSDSQIVVSMGFRF